MHQAHEASDYAVSRWLNLEGASMTPVGLSPDPAAYSMTQDLNHFARAVSLAESRKLVSKIGTNP